MRRRGRRRLRRLWVGGGIALTTLLFMGPFLWLVLTSFMTEKEALSVPPHWIPHSASLDNYRAFFWQVEQDRVIQVGASVARAVPVGIRNSLLVAFLVTVLNLVFGSAAGYALARLRFRGAFPLLLFYLASRSVPGIAIAIPMYVYFQRLGLLDTIMAVVVAHMSFTLPFTVWILKGYFETVPAELERAARVDGCTRLRAFLLIFLPVSVPGLVAAGTFAFMLSWGEFLYALFFTTTLASKTLPVVISGFIAESWQVEYTVIATGGVLAVILPLLLALCFQRFVVQGLVGGAVKG